jgi:SEC-C motif-containing protein
VCTTRHLRLDKPSLVHRGSALILRNQPTSVPATLDRREVSGQRDRVPRQPRPSRTHSPAFLAAVEFAFDFAALVCLFAVFWVPVAAAAVFGSSNGVLLLAFVIAVLLEMLPFVAIVFLHPHAERTGFHGPHWRRGGPVGLGFVDILGIGYYQNPPVLPVPPLVSDRPRRSPPRRNDPCPCGSGEKFKYCHGRPGWRHALWLVLGHGVLRLQGWRRRAGAR